MSRTQASSRRTINVEEISYKAMLAIDGAGFDWSFMADEEVPSDMALMAFSNSEIPDKSRKGLGFVSYNDVPPPPTGLFSPPTIDLSNSGLEEFQQPEFEGYGPKISKSVSEDIYNEVMKSPNALLVEELVSNDKLEKKTVFPNVAKINFVKPQQQEKPIRKPVKYAKMPKEVNTARPNTVVVNAIKENQGHPQIEDQGYVDSGCSRHMTSNMSYLSDFKAFDGGYVTFRGGAKRGRITGKGTLKTGTNSNDFAGKKDDEGGFDNQERPKKSTHDVNTARPIINIASTNDNTGSLNINTGSPIVTTALTETTHAYYFEDEIELDMSNISTTYPVSFTPNTRIHKDHSLDNVIGDVQFSVQTRRMTKTTNDQGFNSAVYEGKTHEDLHTCLFACFLSQEEPKRIAKALSDSAWVEAMQKELLLFKLQKVWILMDLPKGKRAIGTKCIFRNKKYERDIVIRNKARLVAHGYTQEEGIDYDEVFAPIARIEAIRLFLFYAYFMGFMVYQMDVKSAFLYGQIEEEKELCIEFEKLMHEKFQMSSMGELTFFLGLQVKQKEDVIFISQDKYVADILRKSMIRPLMYLTSSRPDIMFAVCACARFQVTPKVSHSYAVKRIFRYEINNRRLSVPRMQIDIMAVQKSKLWLCNTPILTNIAAKANLGPCHSVPSAAQIPEIDMLKRVNTMVE
ncbi:putative ribonuclease H-like domain-containing protein [Tanacetum coccineum]